MDFNEYQTGALKTADYPLMGQNLIYPALKLAGESGEVADKIGKYWRNTGATKSKDLSSEQTMSLIYEMGDSLWYLAALSSELGISLEWVAQKNLEKLHDRQKRGVIKSEGDNR